MIITGKISAIEGKMYRIDIDGQTSGLLLPLRNTRILIPECEKRRIIELQFKIGDEVLAFFEGEGYYSGYILGLIER